MATKTPDDFMVSKLLGEDGDSTVVLARDINTDAEYAIKIIEKIEKGKNKAHRERERTLISQLNHPFLVKLHYAFEDEKRLYFALSYTGNNGDLSSYIEKYTRLSCECAQHYAAELVSALEYMKKLNIVHRDLKPENILLTSDMHINISDFGMAIILPETNDQKGRTSFVGTANYVPPELLVNKASSVNSDLWSLGCIIYQMLTGRPPFHDASDFVIFQKIIKLEFAYPNFLNVESTDVISKLLKFEAEQRIGSDATGGFEPLKYHAFFQGIVWNELPFKMPPRMVHVMTRLSTQSSRSGSSGGETNEARRSTSSRLSPRKHGTMKRQFKAFGADTLPRKLPASEPGDIEGYGVPVELSDQERKSRMDRQLQSTWHHFTDGALIFKHGELEKKRGLSTKTRQLLLMEGPRMVYVDAGSMEMKGEIPWSRELKTEVKSFKAFLIHVPGRTYHMFDKKGNAIKWCQKIDEVKQHYYSS